MKPITNWTFEAVDQELLLSLQDFLPDKAFDIHAHLYRLADLGEQAALYTQGPAQASVEIWRSHVEKIIGPSRLKGGLFVPPPPSAAHYIQQANTYVLDQLKKHPGSKGLVLIAPDDEAADVHAYLANDQVVGFKPFSTFSKHTPPGQAPLASFLPEWAWQMADQHGLVLLVHLVRDKALADPENHLEILRMCQKYPGARLLLDHAARGFHAPNTVQGVSFIKDLDNVWFDLSCICEPTAILSILETFGPDRLVWGTDFPLSQLRGKAVTVGDGFFWLAPDTANWSSYQDLCRPTLIGVESLLATREALTRFGVGKQERQAVFYDNALDLISSRQKKSPA